MLRNNSGIWTGVLLAFGPAHRISRIFYGEGLSRQFEWMEGIDHDGEFAGFLLADAFLDRTRMWTVRNTGRMKGEHPAGDMFAAHEIPIDIIQQLVAVDIAVIVGSRNTLRMVIVHPGDERTNDEIMRLEGLMYGWRLVHPAGDRFKIVDAEGEGITASVPSHDIKGMMGVMQSIAHPFLFCMNEEIASRIDGGQSMWWTDIPLAVRRMFQQLAVFAVVSFRISDRTEGFDDEQSIVCPGEFNPVDGAAGNDQIIAIAEGQLPIHRMQDAGAFVDEDHLISIRILEEIILHTFPWSGEDDMAIVVHQDRDAGIQIIIGFRDIESFEAAVFEHSFFRDLRRYVHRLVGGDDSGRGMTMIKEGIIVRESFGTEELFGIK